MALINTTTTGVLGSTFYGDGAGDLTVQKDGVTVNKITAAPAFAATPSTTQSVTSGVYTKVNLANELFDTNNNFDSSRFTPTIAGYYQINAVLYPVSTNSANYIWLVIYKNGSAFVFGSSAGAASTQDGISTGSALIYLNGTTDYIEMYCYVTGTSPVVQTSGTQLSGFLARAA